MRLYPRRSIELIARYTIAGRAGKLRGCTVVDLSRSGAGALFPAKEKIDRGDVVFLEMISSVTFQSFSATGEVRRIARRGDAIFCGIQFQRLIDEPDFLCLCEGSDRHCT